MNRVTFGNGVELDTDLVVSTPSPKYLYIRLPKKTLLEAMGIATDADAMKKITYLNYSFLDCAVVAVSDESGVPKISATYETISKHCL